MELLAPAGGIEQLRAAVRFGADAVYLATERFGMRARACNFPLETLAATVAEAHAAGAKVHVTCNILMSQRDLGELPAFFEAVDAAGVDALIISDLGAFSLARRYAPHVELHVSTQASVANAEAARMWYDLGAKRIVCAREMSLDDIADMRAHTPRDLEIEVFAHGAMCMAVSGRCLISSYLTGRSANRGHCTQPCRWGYKLEAPAAPGEHGVPGLSDAVADGLSAGVEAYAPFGDRGGLDGARGLVLEEEKRPGVYFPVEEDGGFSFIMNAKDLNMLAHLDDLRAAGVDSIKIEGRNKKAFYVASVVGAYRRVLDGEDPARVEHELYDLSHRPYGTGFFYGEAPQAPDYDGYEQECLHVADVVDCWPLHRAGSPAAAGPHGAQRDETEATVPQAETEAAMPHALCVAGEKGESGSVVVPQPPAGEWGYRVLVRCRNRWSEGDALEALVPRAPVVPLTVRNMVWHPEDVDDEGANLGLGAPVAVAVANRSVALYSFDVSQPIPAGSYLRKRQFRRSARHDG